MTDQISEKDMIESSYKLVLDCENDLPEWGRKYGFNSENILNGNEKNIGEVLDAVIDSIMQNDIDHSRISELGGLNPGTDFFDILSLNGMREAAMAGYLVGEWVRRRNPKLEWGISDDDNLEKGHPAIVGFRYGKQFLPFLFFGNILSRNARLGRNKKHTSAFLKSWKINAAKA